MLCWHATFLRAGMYDEFKVSKEVRAGETRVLLGRPPRTSTLTVRRPQAFGAPLCRLDVANR